MAEIPFPPATVKVRVQWAPHVKKFPNVGDHLQLLAPSQRAHPWPVILKSVDASQGTTVSLTLEFFFQPTNPIPLDTPIELVSVHGRHHHVVARGEASPLMAPSPPPPMVRGKKTP